MYENSSVLDWLLSGDVSIQYQTKRDLCDIPESQLEELRRSISEQGWGKEFVARRDPETGLWGNGVYSPKWVSLHYTLLDLMNLGIHPKTKDYVEGSELLLNRMWTPEKRKKRERSQDMCVCGMILNMCCYAGIQSKKISEIVDYILDHRMLDDGWNCAWDRGGIHSSLHTTLTVLEAFRDYTNNGYTYRLDEIKQSVPLAIEFILKKRLFRSVRTGEIIHKQMTMLSSPSRWKFDILRCLDYFRSVDLPYDSRMDEALNIVVSKKDKNGRWPVQQKYAGLVHFDMEKTGKESRFNTLRALRVIRKYGGNINVL